MCSDFKLLRSDPNILRFPKGRDQKFDSKEAAMETTMQFKLGNGNTLRVTPVPGVWALKREYEGSVVTPNREDPAVWFSHVWAKDIFKASRELLDTYVAWKREEDYR